MMIRHAVICAAVLVAPLAHADEGREVPLAKVCAGIAKSKPADPQGIFRPRMQVKPKDDNPLPADLTLERVADGKTVPVELDAQHSFDPQCDTPGSSEAVLKVNYPKTRVGFGMLFPARVPPGTRMSYAKLCESAPVMKEAIRRQAGMLTFVAPSVVGIKLTLDPGQHVTVDLPDGPKRFDTDAGGVVVLPWNPDWSPAQVSLSAPIKAITPQLSR